MKIEYYGHACFSLTCDNYTIVLDPYKGVEGFEDINLEANEVICSHSHFDHAYIDGVKIVEGISPFKNEKISVFHDDANGTKRGLNDINILKAQDKVVVHLGDLGHLLNKEVIDKIKNCDVLMIPVGGFYTIGIAEALKIIEDVNPKYIIPMHYKDIDKGLSVLESIDEFVKKADKYKDKLLLVKGYFKEIDI